MERESMTATNQPIQHWRGLLAQYRANVQTLRSQLAQYGAGEERLNTLNQLDAALNNIQEAKAALRALGESPDNLPGEPEEIESFPTRFVEEFPHPIAIACQRFNLASEQVERFRRLDDLLWSSVKYLTAIALAQYRADAPAEEQLRGWLGGLSHASLPAWVTILDGICACYRERDPLPRVASELLTGYDARIDDDKPMARAHRHMAEALGGKKALRQVDITTPQILLAQLVAYRSKQWEALDPDANQAQKLLFILQPALRQFLETFGLIAKYPLRYLERADPTKQGWLYTMLTFQGCRELAIPVAKPFQESKPGEKPTYTLRRLYLCANNEQPLLNLHPILIAYHYDLYFLEYNQNNQQISYRPCNQGQMYYPPMHIRSLFLTVLEPAKEDDQEKDSIDARLEQTTNQVEEEENKDRFKQMPSAVLLSYLSPEGWEALAIALGEALRIGRNWLGVEFLLMGLSKQSACIFPAFLAEIGLDPGSVRGALRGLTGEVQKRDWRNQDVLALGTAALPQLRQVEAERLRQEFAAGADQPPVYTPRVQRVLEAAQSQAGDGQIGHVHLLWALLQEQEAVAVRLFFAIAHEQGWSPKQVLMRLAELVGAKPGTAAAAALPGAAVESPPSSGPASAPPTSPGLAKYGRDLTAEAQAGKLRPAVGESARQAMTEIGRILLQREANNPLLIGDPGVGKSALVEGFAWRLAGQGNPVVPQLAGRRVIELAANSLTAGTKYRGELEARVQQLLATVKAAEGQIILFIDEIHSLLASSASSGVADALKPALARGELPCIGATTVAEYRQHIEKDGALARRFTPVWLAEPTVVEALEIVSQVAKEHLAKHHTVTFDPAAVEAAVRLADRYILDERLPGKAIKLLDKAAAGRIVHGSLSGGMVMDATQHGNLVTVDDILAVVAERTNIPISQLGKTDKQRLLELEAKLKTRIIGQDEAISQVVRLVRRAGAGLTDPQRPQGVFLLAGPTGVGKTELALALTEALFDRQEAIHRLDMSEFMEKHQVARLTGAPPGYVGYGDEGQLTGRLRRQPYSVVLLDEMEKAHPEVQHLFLQLFDTGRLTDAQGRVADGRRAFFLMTTNLGAKEATGFADSRKSYEEKLLAAIHQHFTPEFVNRIDRIICFTPLDETALLAIFDREFDLVQARLQQEKGITLKLPAAVKTQLVQQAAQAKQGARPVRRLIEDQILAAVVDKLLAEDVAPGTQIAINLTPLQGRSSFAPKFDLSPPALGDFAPRPALPLARPTRPASPAAGLPHLDDKEAALQQRFDDCYTALATRLFDQGIALEIDAFAKRYFFPPLVQSLTIDHSLSLEEAFEQLITDPLTKKILAEEFQTGDWVRIEMFHTDVVFKKMGAPV